jgi:hypothetical protein
LQVETLPGVTQPISLITDVQLTNWGGELVLECLDDLLTRRPFQLVFTNCREIRWSLHDPEATPAEEADVIGFCPGQAEYIESAVLTTDIFEVTVLYDRVEIRALQVVAS